MNSKPIDVLISEKIIQTTYNKGHLIYQRADWSNIAKKKKTLSYPNKNCTK